MTDEDKNILNSRLGKLEESTQVINEQVIKLSEDMTSVQEKLDNMDSKLDKLSGSLVRIENTIGVFSDAYKQNKDEIKELDKRATKIEEHLNLPTSNN